MRDVAAALLALAIVAGDDEDVELVAHVVDVIGLELAPLAACGVKGEVSFEDKVIRFTADQTGAMPLGSKARADDGAKSTDCTRRSLKSVSATACRKPLGASMFGIHASSGWMGTVDMSAHTPPYNCRSSVRNRSACS